MASAKVVTVLSVIGLLLVAPADRAAAGTVEKGNFGLGLIIGEPTGVSAKLYLTDTTAIDAAIGFAFVGGGIHVHADYLWHPWILTKEPKFVLPAYIGLGGRLFNHNRGRGTDTDDFHLGVRAVIGILFDFTDVPLDAFLEVAGVLDYRTAGDTHGGFPKGALNAGAGVRYYF